MYTNADQYLLYRFSSYLSTTVPFSQILFLSFLFYNHLVRSNEKRATKDNTKAGKNKYSFSFCSVFVDKAVEFWEFSVFRCFVNT